MFRKSQRRKTSKNSRTNASTCTSLQPGQGCNVTCAEPYTGGQGENATWAYCPGSTTIEGAFLQSGFRPKSGLLSRFFLLLFAFFSWPLMLSNTVWRSATYVGNCNGRMGPGLSDRMRPARSHPLWLSSPRSGFVAVRHSQSAPW